MSPQMMGRTHNVHAGDNVYLTDRGWVDVVRADANTHGKVCLDVRQYGADNAPVLRVALPWDAPLVVVLPG